MAKCDVCGRREAVYKRIYSGHKLCPRCLERILARSIKRAICDSNLLRPRSKILIPVRPSEPSHSLAIILLLSRVEEKFNATLHVLVPKVISHATSISRAVTRARKRVEVDVHVRDLPIPAAIDAVSCIRYERAWSLFHARNIEVDVVAFPISRSCLNLVGVESLLSGNVEALSESLPLLHWTKPPVIIPSVYVEGEALAAYSFLEDLLVDPACSFNTSAKTPLLSIMGGRPELEFSSNKTIMRVASKLATLDKCPVCGGYTKSIGVCKYCRETGASRFFPFKEPL